MTDAQYDRWYANHVAHFPDLDTWMAKRAADDITAVWRKTLLGVTPDDAADATTQLYQAETQSPYGRHAAIVAGICWSVARSRRQAVEPQYVDGEPVYRCLQCKDDGRVIVWRAKSMRAARDGTLGEPFTEGTCAVACNCQAGEDTRYLARYDPTRMLIVGLHESVEAERQELRDFVAAMKTTVREPQEWVP